MHSLVRGLDSRRGSLHEGILLGRIPGRGLDRVPGCPYQEGWCAWALPAYTLLAHSNHKSPTSTAMSAYLQVPATKHTLVQDKSLRHQARLGEFYVGIAMSSSQRRSVFKKKDRP